ncbi:hypothetical protein ACWGB8_31220 [Kitasatospora sp. NPDC054939]
MNRTEHRAGPLIDHLLDAERAVVQRDIAGAEWEDLYDRVLAAAADLLPEEVDAVAPAAAIG